MVKQTQTSQIIVCGRIQSRLPLRQQLSHSNRVTGNPGPHYLRSACPQPGCQRCSFYIPLNLINPKLLVGMNVVFFISPIIAMPKFTVTENCNFFANKGYIRMTIYRLYILPVSQSSGPQFLAKNKFYIRILTLYCLHISMSLFGSMVIHIQISLISLLLWTRHYWDTLIILLSTSILYIIKQDLMLIDIQRNNKKQL